MPPLFFLVILHNTPQGYYVYRPWTSPTHGRLCLAYKCLSLAGGPRAGASRSARAEF
uniref:Uncharacterized protein n=1 Tax=Siphoviridae sp. ctB3v5 TaxID=2826186 RepID=A0A8S5M8N6_9CAUD|nr:MAG TPA: hypothetical protein [Siphoviridae sp. ctB3v5]